MGYAIASVLAYVLGQKLPALNVPVDVPLPLIGAMFLVTIVICVSASVSSVMKVFKLEPGDRVPELKAVLRGCERIG